MRRVDVFRLPFAPGLTTRLFLQKREQQLQIGETVALTGVGALQGSPPDRLPIAADLPQTQHVCEVALLFVGIAVSGCLPSVACPDR